MAKNFNEVASEAWQLVQELEHLCDAFLDLQRDYDAGEIPDGHDRFDCFKDLSKAINDAVYTCQMQFKNEV